ncbi:short-chain dehydrogenase/reductase SDR (plasmid) [Haloterrigena turkmenica DSM 5511]|uniref:Short-chain dehydrogenase/reductase SDR n=1 Tax=Haloterrigena turkmenica (strain ATCC 51198 / DSM 5511 / JCM 9101 / NCIMB 13204 / VKM B-1734 / 4k) TaxID=543526 RepID=D2S008_HALTV|nr:mycofactocin-coupled SDR family oxidoreductase [Haloterrigena turkmenica]ADB62705.1 short-chain dehydrogenase/reductase SDR [Haloterrigena turkmenica DSM 5511]
MPEYDFSGQVAFVTGAARGQGRSHAKLYAEHGADVVIVDVCDSMDSIPYNLGTRDELDSVVEAVEDRGQDALALECDVSNEADVEEAVDQAIEEFGRIDFLANNAGIFTLSEAVEMSEAEWDRVLDTNLKGVWLCAKHVGKHMIERGDGGKIINTSSGYGLVGGLLEGHYTASKHGVNGLTKTLALELAEYDINVNAVAPTGVDTPMMEEFVEVYGDEILDEVVELTGPWNIFGGGMIESRDISEAYMWLSSDASRYVTGITLPVDAGLSAK